MNRTLQEKRLEICRNDCPHYKVVRGNIKCPLFGNMLKRIAEDPKAVCTKGYWSGMIEEPKILFYRDKSTVVDLQNHWFGSKCFLVSNGPNRHKHDLLLLLERPGIATMTLNNGAYGFRSTFWNCQDTTTKFMDAIWQDPSIMKFTSMSNRKGLTPSKRSVIDMPNVFFHKRASATKIGDWFNQEFITWNTTSDLGANVRSTMLATIHLLYVLGFRTVYVIGADFHMSETNKYSFAQDRSEGSIRHNNVIFEMVNNWLEYMKPIFKERKFRIFKCDGNMNVPFVDFYDAVDDCTIDTSASTEGMY